MVKAVLVGVIPLLLAALVISQVRLNIQVAVMEGQVSAHLNDCASEMVDVRRRLDKLED